MTLDEWEAGYLRACGAAVQGAIREATDAFPEIAKWLSEQGCMCILMLSEGVVNVGLDSDFDLEQETDEEAAFLERLQDSLYALSTMTLVNAMADISLDAYEGCFIEFPLIED